MGIFKIGQAFEKYAKDLEILDQSNIMQDMVAILLKKERGEINAVLLQGVRYFRQRYRNIPNPYPGDEVYYAMFKRAAEKFGNLKEAEAHVNSIITREFAIIQDHLSVGKSYTENWY